jgi:hypothetical protein
LLPSKSLQEEKVREDRAQRDKKTDVVNRDDDESRIILSAVEAGDCV